ncbi:hypothetical protein OF897_21155 [Chryseobacterium formosus]|uniref:Uncharacterized protein n=1 Tax=Chryseobacterium formosus TaxID=1537363 RepID=A0ABT3XXN2_9FLAO|nr:hypothetical protein [Chryseobacterium formosus]MCX8526430.1 hypothetical protein [Chryseobacterium formosus]
MGKLFLSSVSKIILKYAGNLSYNYLITINYCRVFHFANGFSAIVSDDANGRSSACTS